MSSYHALTRLDSDVITAVLGQGGKHLQTVSIADQVRVSLRKGGLIRFTRLLGLYIHKYIQIDINVRIYIHMYIHTYIHICISFSNQYIQYISYIHRYKDT